MQDYASSHYHDAMPFFATPCKMLRDDAATLCCRCRDAAAEIISPSCAMMICHALLRCAYLIYRLLIHTYILVTLMRHCLLLYAIYFAPPRAITDDATYAPLLR